MVKKKETKTNRRIVIPPAHLDVHGGGAQVPAVSQVVLGDGLTVAQRHHATEVMPARDVARYPLEVRSVGGLDAPEEMLRFLHARPALERHRRVRILRLIQSLRFIRCLLECFVALEVRKRGAA